MLEHSAESQGGLLDSVDMRPIDLSVVDNFPRAHHTSTSSDTAQRNLPSLTIEKIDFSSVLRTIFPVIGGAANEAGSGAAAGAAAGAADKSLPEVKLTDAEAAQCRPEQQRIESEAIKSTLGKFDDRVPGMIVRMPENYDPCKPINLLVYNHGFGSTAKSAIKESDLDAQMKNAPPNTVLVIPEWQSSPASRSGAQGAFKNDGYFDHKMDEVFAKIPALQGRSASDIANVNIVAHSAGYGPTETEIYHNKLSSKVKSITLLDSLYDPTGFDPWLKQNIHALADGSKQFINIYHGTSDASVAQAQRVKTMLKKEGLPDDKFYMEHGNGKRIVSGAELAKHSIIFKYSSATVDNKDAHASLPSIYVARVNESNAYNI